MGKSNTMPCPQCGAWTDIIETRTPEPHIRRRRYECANGHRFITISTEVFIGMIEQRKDDGAVAVASRVAELTHKQWPR